MNACILQYRNKLKKAIQCGYRARKRLLEQFDLSLEAFLEDYPAAGEAQITAAFGPPEEMAQVLMASVTEAERRQFHTQRRYLRIAAVILAALLLAVIVSICL